MNIILKFGEFFCGPGGLAFGAINASGLYGDKNYIIEHSWANDIDEYACMTYRRNIAGNIPKSVVCKDIKQLDISIFNPVDIFAFGFSGFKTFYKIKNFWHNFFSRPFDQIRMMQIIFV